MFDALWLQQKYFYPGFNRDVQNGIDGNNATCGMGRNTDVGIDRRCAPEAYIDVHNYGLNAHFACIGPCSVMPTYRPGAWGQGNT